MREKRASFFSVSIIIGITPACAGKTLLTHYRQGWGRDHPRVCGKNRITITRVSLSPGSPPRVREKLSRFLVPDSNDRITPACAGKTDGVGLVNTTLRDHPRVCGKNLSKILTAWSFMGSPPRVREKLHEQVSTSASLRITPACAGKTINKRILMQS